MLSKFDTLDIEISISPDLSSSLGALSRHGACSYCWIESGKGLV